MEAKLKREHLDCYSLVYTGAQTREETGESVVPDTLPDIARIVDADASVCMRTKGVQDSRVLLEGNILGTVLYLAENDPRLYRLEVNLSCAFAFDGGAPESGDKVVASLHVDAADARLLNPRKILLRADVAAWVAVYRASALEYSTEPEDAGALQTLTAEKTVSYVSAVGEKTFVLAEEFTLPSARPALARLLHYRAEAAVEDVKQVGGKMILQGTVWLQVLYAPGEGNTPVREDFSTAFSQIADVPEGQGSGAPQVVLMPTACFAEPLPGAYGSSAVSLELHLTAQTVCRAEQEIRYIADAYSTRCACTVREEVLQVSGACRCVTLRDTVRELLETPDSVGEAVSCYAVTGTPAVSGDGLAVPVCVHALYMTDRGLAASLQKKLSVQMALEIPAGAVCLPGAPLCTDPYIAMAAGGLELRLPVELKAELQDTETLSCVAAAELDTDSPCPAGGRPSLVAVRCPEGGVWALAKKYGSTPALIEAANPAAPEPGALLLIPRAR